jgi:hypothetical protein
MFFYTELSGIATIKHSCVALFNCNNSIECSIASFINIMSASATNLLLTIHH